MGEGELADAAEEGAVMVVGEIRGGGDFEVARELVEGVAAERDTYVLPERLVPSGGDFGEQGGLRIGQGEQIGDVGRRARGEEKLRPTLVGSSHERSVQRPGASGQALTGEQEKIGAVKSGGRGRGDVVEW